MPDRMPVPDEAKHLSSHGWCHTCDKAVAGCEEGMAVAHAQRYVGGYPFTSTFARWEIAEILAILSQSAKDGAALVATLEKKDGLVARLADSLEWAMKSVAVPSDAPEHDDAYYAKHHAARLVLSEAKGWSVYVVEGLQPPSKSATIVQQENP